MKVLFFVLSFLAAIESNSLAQISFIAVPKQFQLYPRDLSTNKAQIPISGTVDAGYKEIKVDMYRDNVLIDTKAQILNGTANQAFSFNDEIVAELSTYKFVTSLKDAADNYNVISTIDNVVAGDAIIIQGQSNAVAQQWETAGNSLAYLNNYIRVYGSGIESFDPNMVHQWFLAQGDGNESTTGNTGQWGLVLGDTIVKTTKRPIAIFNGARSAELVEYFQRNDANKTDVSTNYGRLLTRITEAGFNNNIRAIFWYQGEANALNNQSTTGGVKNYKSLLLQLMAAWKEDYPAANNLYISQIRQGCLQPFDSTNIVKEAQRQIALENSNTRIYGTGRLTHIPDDCHFTFKNGYETLGKDWAAPLFEDLFGITAGASTTSPFVKNIQRVNGNQVVLTMNKSDNLTIPADALANFVFQGIAVQPTITSATFTGNGITLSLDNFPAGITGLSYTEINESYIANDRGLAMVNFFNQSISSLLPLRLLSFNATFQNSTDAFLQWTTADESNISSYKIEASADGNSFHVIGEVVANNGSGNQSYSFVDKNAEAKSYYRLRIIEKNGNVSYSPIQLLTRQVTKLSLAINPNPASADPMVFITSPISQTAQIVVHNASGQRVASFSKKLNIGSNSFVLDLPFINHNGVYFMNLLTNTSAAQTKFIVSK